MSEATHIGERANVLLVDDHPARLLSYRAILEPLGERLIEVGSGTEALRSVMDTEFAVILLDVNMPDMDGFETASLIHQHPRFEKTPIIFVSAVNVTDMDRLRGYKLGAVDYVMVPIIPEILRGKVLVLAELFRKRRELQRLNDSLAAANAELGRSNDALRIERAREVHKLNETLSATNAQLAASNRSLKMEIKERRNVECRLREADRRKDEFLATLAHELRNPLAPIQGALNAHRLAQGTQAGDDDRLYPIMERQTRQLVRLVDDLLDVSRITRDRLELRRERVDLVSIFSAAIETAQPLIDEGGHELQVDLPSAPVYLQADAHRLAQVFGNLLNNACKFSDPGGRIVIGAELSPQSIAVTIRDHGIGLSSEQLQHVFELFVQADTSLQRPHSGLGIGLTLSRRLIEMHGGTIQACSEGLGKGSGFTVTLPLAAAGTRTVEEKAPPARSSPARPLRIMVVDDNRDSADMLALSLKIMGHEVRTLYDPLRVADAAPDFDPQLIFMDIGMPGLNGFDLAEQVLSRPWRDRPPRLIALTGWGQEEDRQRSVQAGFSDHLVKPADLETIERVLLEATGQVAAGRGDKS